MNTTKYFATVMGFAVSTLALVHCGSGETTGPAGHGGATGGSSGSGGSGAVATGGSSGNCATQGQDCLSTACCTGLTCCGPPIAQPDAAPSGTCFVGCPVSDRNQKRNFESVDPNDVLEHLSRVPISTWSYKTEDSSVRHIGPMAQDFKAEFGVGASDRAIFQIDADGVALASIQALRERLLLLERQNAALEKRVHALESGTRSRR